MDRAKKKSVIVKGVCVLLSFILWLYVSNVENPTRTSDVKGVSVELLNKDVLTSSNLFISPEQDFTVNLKLEGGAKEIYSVNKNDFVLKADLSNYALKKGENNVPVEVESSPEGVNIKNRAVLTVRVKLEEATEKNVKVYSQVKTTFKQGISQKSISVSPSSVKVSGPESLVKNVSSVVLKGEMLDISKDMTQNFPLAAVDADGNEINGVELSDSKGRLIVNVGIEKSVKINPVYKGSLPENLTLKGITLSAESINLVGDSSTLIGISQVDTEPINLSDITESRNINIKLNLPEGVSVADSSDKISAAIQVIKKEDNTNAIINKKIDGIKVNLTDKENTALTYEVNSITVEVSGKAGELNILTAENIIASASTAGITSAGEYEVNLSISLTNAGSSITIITKPEKVKVIVK